MPLTRRELLELLAASGLLAGCRPEGPLPAPEPGAEQPPPLLDAEASVDVELFAHGVASGDPLADRVILWTRLEPGQLGEALTGEGVEVLWVLARDAQLRDIVMQGVTETSAARDFTVKVDATRLEPGTHYYYRFGLAGDEQPARASDIGRTRTLPGPGVERLRLAYCSCSNYPYGYFNAYAAIACRELDCVLHLGDYIYEYADGRYGTGSELGRELKPPGELVSLADYRARHAIYKRDPDAQLMHRTHPMIAVWDDHELANNAWIGGAQNHDPSTQGSWEARRAAAVQAYFEWMPIRGPGPNIERSFRFGELVDLIMLDTRLVGRSAQAEPEDEPARRDSSRRPLGRAQARWLGEQLLASKREGLAWRLLGQQVAFSQLRFDPDRPPSTDTWDGYEAARGRVFELLEREAIDDVVVLTGDIHSSWALEVARDPWSKDAQAREPRVVELITPAVSSPGPVPAERAGEFAEDFLARHPHLRWVELESRGYVVLDIERSRIRAQWWFMDTVRERRADERLAKTFVIERGAARLHEGS